MDKSHRVADLTWDEVGRRLEGGAMAVLPVGAGAKQHGLHLPMATDRITADHLSAELAQRMDALSWPTLSYGFYPAFVAYAGSVSLSRATFTAAVKEIIDGLIGFGARRVLVLDTGISTLGPVADAILQSMDTARVRHAKIFAGPQFTATAGRLRTQAHGSHADEIETSLLLAIAPHVVDMARAKASPPALTGAEPGPLTPDDPVSPNYAPSGSFGDPTRATREKGEALLAAILDDLQAVASS
ncbi:MAG: creatininase family protein [Hyphomicrobium sp.]